MLKRDLLTHASSAITLEMTELYIYRIISSFFVPRAFPVAARWSSATPCFPGAPPPPSPMKVYADNIVGLAPFCPAPFETRVVLFEPDWNVG